MKLPLVAHNQKKTSITPHVEALVAALAAGSIPFEIDATAVQVGRLAARHSAIGQVENHGCHGFAVHMAIPFKAIVRGSSNWINITPAADYSHHHLRQPDASDFRHAADTATADV